MIGKTLSIRFGFSVPIVSTLLICGFTQAEQQAAMDKNLIDVFKTTELAVVHDVSIDHEPYFNEIQLEIYNLDGINRIEGMLSIGLTADPEQSRKIVLQRFQNLHEEDHAQLKRAAMGFAKVVKYGIDRYPAIVFDGEYVVYGMADVREALHQYKKWREDRHQ